MMEDSDDSAQLHIPHSTGSSVKYKSYQSKSMTDIGSNSISSSSSNKLYIKKPNDSEVLSEHPNKENVLSKIASFIKDAKHNGSIEYICGMAAAWVNITITFPINKIIFRQMLHNVKAGGAFDQIKSEGFLFLYRGVLPPLLQKSISTSLMFGLYENCRSPLLNCPIPTVLGNSTAAILAGAVEALLTPFERLQTIMQDQHYHTQFKSTGQLLRIISVEYGLKELYRGFTPIILRNAPSNVCFFALRDYCNETIPDSQLWYLKWTKQFMIGALIGTGISSMFYPLNVVKVHMQNRIGGPYQTVGAAFVEVFLVRNRNIREIYRGVYMNCTRSFISWGVINVSYETIKSMFI